MTPLLVPGPWCPRYSSTLSELIRGLGERVSTTTKISKWTSIPSICVVVSFFHRHSPFLLLARHIVCCQDRHLFIRTHSQRPPLYPAKSQQAMQHLENWTKSSCRRAESRRLDPTKETGRATNTVQ